MSDFEGELVQIDYRDDGTISAFHAEGPHGEYVVIRLDPPAEPMEEIRPGQPSAVFSAPSRRPRVRIEHNEERG